MDPKNLSKQELLQAEGSLPPGDLSQYDIAALLPDLLKLGPTDVYVEIGVQYGRSLCLAARYSKARVFGVDIQPTLCEWWLRNEGLEYTYYFLGSDAVSKDWSDPISMLFIDGDHSYEGCKKDIDNWAKFVKPGGAIFFHDCDETSPGVVEAANEYAASLGKPLQLFKTKDANTSMARIQL